MAASGSSTGSANIPIGAQFSFFGNPRALSSGVKKQRSRLRKLTKQNVLGRSADRPCKFRPHCRLSPDSKHRNPLHPARKGPVNVLRSVRTVEPKQPTLLGRGTRNMRPARTNRDLLKSDRPLERLSQLADDHGGRSDRSSMSRSVYVPPDGSARL